MSKAIETEPPSSKEAILRLLEAQRTKVTRWKAARVREVELEAEQELANLEQVAGILSEKRKDRDSSTRRSRAAKRKSPAALAGERREAIARLLDERGEALAINEISRILRTTEFSTRRAIKRLCEEGKVSRIGTGASTRYESRQAGNDAAGGAKISGTTAGRLLEVIQSRVSATLGELAQATSVDEEEVRRVCGGLIVDGEIQMSRRGSQAVYVARRAA